MFLKVNAALFLPPLEYVHTSSSGACGTKKTEGRGTRCGGLSKCSYREGRGPNSMGVKRRSSRGQTQTNASHRRHTHTRQC
jgi:hypothetical protein